MAEHDRALCWDADLNKTCTCPCSVCRLFSGISVVCRLFSGISVRAAVDQAEHDGVYREGDLTYRGR